MVPATEGGQAVKAGDRVEVVGYYGTDDYKIFDGCIGTVNMLGPNGKYAEVMIESNVFGGTQSIPVKMLKKLGVSGG